MVTEEEIVIDNDVILDGAGNLTIDGPDEYYAFRVSNTYPMTAELAGFSLTGACDGVFVSPGANLTLVDSTLSGNSCAGIYNDGGATLTNCTVSGNGIGVLNWDGDMTVTESTVFGNEGRGIEVGQGHLSQISGTVSGNGGGGIANGRGGGIYVGWPATLTLTNSTVSNNSAPQGSGGGIFNADTVVLIGATISGNTAAEGSGIYLTVKSFGNRPPEKMTMTMSGTLMEDDCVADATIGSQGYNVESPGNTCGFDQPSDQVNVSAEDLRLGRLQDNGGPTETHALGAGSIAIDVIPEDDCVDANGDALTTDQRGEPRPETGGTMCDVGAFELQP